MEMNEKELYDLRKLLDASFFRDCVVLKELKCLTPSLLANVGFTEGEIKERGVKVR